MVILSLIASLTVSGPYYTVFLEGYPGRLMLARLPDLDEDTPGGLEDVVDVTPEGMEGKCGNPDVSPDGTKLVFGGITEGTGSWDIYAGDLDVEAGIFENVTAIVATNAREEDPRYNYDATTIIYKSGKSWVTPVIYNIHSYSFDSQAEVIVSNCSCHEECEATPCHCELWGPVYHPCGRSIAYAKRSCGSTENFDEVYIKNLETNSETRITTNTIPDMYQHFTRAGRLVFSRKEFGVDNLYTVTEEGSVTFFLNKTASDDDPYGFKDTEDYLMFIGQSSTSTKYEMYVWRKTQNDAVVIPYGSSILGPVVFSLEGVTVPRYCDGGWTTQTPSVTPFPEPVTFPPRTYSPKVDPDDDDTKKKSSRTYSVLLWVVALGVLCGTTIYLMWRRMQKRRQIQAATGVPIGSPLYQQQPQQLPNMGVYYAGNMHVNPLGYQPPQLGGPPPPGGYPPPPGGYPPPEGGYPPVGDGPPPPPPGHVPYGQVVRY